MNSIGLSHYLVLSGILFLIGFIGIIICKNLIKILLCLEILINAVCISFISVAHFVDGIKLEGAAFAVFIIMFSFINASILISVAVNIYKHKRTADVEKLENLKG